MESERIMGRCWPDGEFCLWSEKRSFEIEPERANHLGLSKVSNSHKMSDDPRVQVRKGLSGITLYGQRMVRNAAFLMQKAWGKRQLSFLTCTLPGGAYETTKAAECWSEIVRKFISTLKREIESAGLPGMIVSVTEIQPKRMAREGGCPLHLHLVFRGALKDRQWCIRPGRLQLLWSRAVLNTCPEFKGLEFAASCNVQMVRNSASGYLGKYMSKGPGDIQASIEANEGCLDHLPHHWYNLTKEARDLVKKNTAYGPEVGRKIDKWMRWKDELDSPFLYRRSVVLYSHENEPITSFVIGTISPNWRHLLGVPRLKYDILGL